MNDITQALQQAGVKLPSQNQRIWTWLKDNGPHRVVDVTSELKLPQPSVQAAITVMVRRKMLEKIERKNHKGVRITNHYGALGRTFVLLPEPGKRGAAGRAAANAKHVAPEEVAPVKAEFSAGHLLADCTLAEMRQVYNFLSRVFK